MASWDPTSWATFWAFAALLIFLVVLVVMGVPKTLTAALDRRSAGIAAELAEARRLREEAQALLAEYGHKRASAEQEAAQIIAAARDEANRLTSEAETSLAELIERRTRAVETKIAQAETQALADVRSTAAEVAIAAATRILSERVRGDFAAALVDKSIADVKARLN